MYIDEDQLYNEKRIKIPTPHFVVFYNGIDELPEEMTYKLSEMYEQKTDNPELELTIKVLNINHGMNQSLMRGCKMLNDYSIYVSKEREFYEEYDSHEKAVIRAIDYCIENDILRDFLLKERKAVYMYSLSEYNQTAHLKSVFEDGKEQGIAIGEERSRKDGIRIFIEDKLEDHVPEETIIHKLMTKYELTKEEAMEYIEKYRI